MTPWVGQQEGEGGIVDMFMDDIKDDKPKKKSNQKINPNSRKQLIHRMERDLQTLKSMEPR